MNSLPVNILSIDTLILLKNCASELPSQINFHSESTSYEDKNYEKLFILSSITLTETKINKNNSLDALSTYIPEVNLLCSIEKLDDGVTYIFPLDYVSIENLMTKEGIVYATYQKLDLKNQYPSQNDLEELKNLIIYLINSSEYSNANLQELILESRTADEICNVMAFSLFKDPFDLYIYQQCLDQKSKFKEIIEILMKNTPVFSLSLDDISFLSQKKDSAEKLTDKKIFQMFLQEFNNQISQQPQQEPPTSLSDDVEESLPPKVLTKYKKEKRRLKRLPQSSLEYQTALDYLELIEEMPWNNNTSSNYSLQKIQSKLDLTHAGLSEVKQNVLDHFALELHTGKPCGNIMCFVGSPGTGKTSIVKSIAQATGRKIIKIALGGMTDEAEFRGHRRTYVASKPGRIIESIVQAGVMNPIILLDEIDKIGKDHRNDPSSALLEILDPEQNTEFIDRYLELPIDLSKCLFIATANYKKQIPAPLLDRLDIIEFKDYSEEEKLNIFKDYTVPNKLKELNMEDFNLNFSDDFYEEIKTFSNRESDKILTSILKNCIFEYITTQNKTFEITKTKINKTKPKKIGF